VSTIEGARTLILLTEWNQFRRLDLKKVERRTKEIALLILKYVFRRDCRKKKSSF
jgi:UDP-glucose 6-dehydrogenase